MFNSVALQNTGLTLGVTAVHAHHVMSLWVPHVFTSQHHAKNNVFLNFGPPFVITAVTKMVGGRAPISKLASRPIRFNLITLITCSCFPKPKF